MASSAPAVEAGSPAPPAIDAARKLHKSAEEAEASQNRERFQQQLKAYLAFVEDRRAELGDFGPELAHQLDDAAMAFYRMSSPDLALRSVDLGLGFSAHAPALLHHKALFLLAANRDTAQVVPLLEEAARGDPNDKSIWATLGDALKVAGRPRDAADAYLRAQQLDATSTQYVEKALRLVPGHPEALRQSLQLAKGLGGNQQALEACEALLSTSPNDPELLFARVELLAELGQIGAALDAVAPARQARPGDPKLALLAGRLQVAADHPTDAIAEFQMGVEAADRLSSTDLSDLAERIESTGIAPELAIRARELFRAREPRNLANLTALRFLAQRSRKFDLGISACRQILEVSPGNLEATRALAEFLMTSQKTEEGLQTYRTLVHEHPHETPEIRKAIDAARAAGRPDLVKEFARAIVDEEPTDLATREELAKSLVSEGDAAAALEEYRQLAAADPREARYLYEERALLTTLGRPGELTTVYARLFELDPANSELAFDRGRFSLEAARTAAEGSSERLEAARAAVASFERSASEPKFSEGSLLGLADAARLSGDPTRAIRAYEEFLAKPESSSNTKVLKELGHALREQGRFEEAASTYDRALGLGLEDPDLLWGEVEVLAETNADGKALRYIDILSQRDPANLLYRRRKGQLLLRAGRRAEGIRVLREVAETARTDPVALFEVAHALRSDGDYAEAIESYREGLKADPAHRAGRIAFAETLNLAGRYNEALPIVDALLNEEPNDLAAWKARADSCRALGRTGDLEYSLKAILLLDPTHSPALVEKYRLHLGEGQKLEALECLTQFLDAGGPESGNTALLLEAGDLAAELGRTDEAGRLYERASELDPGQRGAIGVRKARMRLSAGRPDLALEVLDGATPAGTDAAPGSESLRGDILMAMERPAEAESVYRAILARDPSAPLVLLGLARALLDQGKHAEARTLLVEAIPKAPPTLGPFLLLAESESGLGSAPNAIRAIQKGLEVLPDSKELWTRLGELEITQEAWPDAAAAFGNAVRIDPANPSLLLKAGYVAERLGHRTEALSLYERATQSGPSDKQTWTSRGLALLANDRPEEATASFDRALALDSDFDPAKQGRKAAVERTREAQVDRFGREALLLEARLHRTVTKNDLFVTLHVPFDFLEPVLSGVTRDPKVDLSQLDEAQLHQLETASYQIITAALDRRSEGVERRGFSLADVAVLSPSGRSLKEIQQLFGYLRAVLEVELRPENLKLEPDVEELARRALLLPAEQRTLFQIVRNLKVGIFRARLIKVVESSGSAVHAPLPSLDLGAYTPEFRTDRPSPPAGGEPIAEVEPPPPMEAPAKPSVPSTPPADKPMPSAARCVGCGGLASILHACGAPVCAHCVVEFGTCPKCRLPASLPTNPTPPPTAAHHRASSGPIAESGPTRGTLHALKQVVARAKGSGRSSPAARSTPGGSADAPGPSAPASHHAPPPAPAEKPAPPPHPSRPREKPDDEPRL